MELIAKLGINWQLLLAQIVNFLIVLGVLTYFVYTPLLDLLDRRTHRIQKAMQEAKRLEEEAKKLGAHRIEKLKEIDEECGRVLAAARTKAEALHAEMRKIAQSDSEKLLEKGRQDLRRERDTAMKDIQKSLATVILKITQQILEREFSPADQKKTLQKVSETLPSLLR